MAEGNRKSASKGKMQVHRVTTGDETKGWVHTHGTGRTPLTGRQVMTMQTT